MSVYIDPLQKAPLTNDWKYKWYCHLIGDSVSELKEFAQKLDLKQSWFQPKSFPHFDLTKAKRELALKNGAIELNLREMGMKMRELRTK